ncbi:MAG: helix-turn-helix transcriptional regulator [Bacteroidales bacterium]|nr:helix-turn-helix transcriptional regulator [Bacteroidales bacterium]
MSQKKNIEILQKIAQRLKDIRNQNGVSLQEVCDETGINIARIEALNLNITIDTLSKLCDYYGINFAEFFKDFH